MHRCAIASMVGFFALLAACDPSPLRAPERLDASQPSADAAAERSRLVAAVTGWGARRVFGPPPPVVDKPAPPPAMPPLACPEGCVAKTKANRQWCEQSPDVAHGPMRLYYANGQLYAEGQFEAGQAVGTWRWYHANGKLRQRIEMSASVPHGRTEPYWPNGSLHYRQDFDHGLLVCAQRYYYADGGLQEAVDFVAGRREGPAEARHPNGALRWQGSYAADRRSGAWSFSNADGHVEARCDYRDGRLASGDPACPP